MMGSHQNPDLPAARDQAKDLLARARPARFVATFIEQLESEGQAVIARLFKIATDEETPPAVALKAIDQIMRLSNTEGIMQVALGLKKTVGRPGSEKAEAEARQSEEWADIVDLEESPPGSGHYEEID